jgi:uncharacterized protein (DUF2235 family)
MKRIVLCFDGTWDKPADNGLPPDQEVESNVSRFYKSVSANGPDGVAQVAWYNAGVGTEWYSKLAGGAFGAGLDKHILDGYCQLVKSYEEGDEVFVLGFSRGAYAARSMVGMIRNCGLVRPSFAEWQAGVAYGIYRTRDDGPDSATARAFRAAFAQEITIKFLGVWDTVGALGIPLQFADRLNRAYYQFHDTQLSGIVQRAYQAVALDEHREDYAICLWDSDAPPTQTLEQRWFCGAHADVGGGYTDRKLSDTTLRWMQDRATAAGLGLSLVTPDADAYKAPISDSYGDFLDGLYAKTHAPCYRRVFATTYGNEVIDPSIDRRRTDVALKYLPLNLGLPPLPPQIA